MNEQPQVHLVGVVGYCFAIPVLQFMAVPVFMISNDPANYAFIDVRSLIISSFVLSACSALLLLALYKAIAAWRNAGTAITVLRFLFWWVLIAGFLLPVSLSVGMVEAHAVETDIRNLVLTAVIAAAATWLCQTEARQYAIAFAFVFSLFTIGSSTFSLFQSGVWKGAVVAEDYQHESMRLSAGQNVLVISFDGIQGHIAAKLLRDNPEMAELFRDFTLFENVLSQSPATEASIVGELFGIRDYKALGNSLQDVIAELERRGLADEIPLRRYEDAYQKGYMFGKGMQIPRVEAAFTADSIEFLKFALARVATRYVVDNRVSNYVFASLVDLLARDDSDDLTLRLRNHKGPSWDKRYIAEVQEFDAFVQDLTVTQKDVSYRYLHFGFTHFPVDFDRRCVYRSDDRKWFNANQDSAGLANETFCAFSKLSEFLKRLKELGIYDNAFIVLKSDHGHPTNYFEDYPYNLEINGHTLWGYSRYRPLLMIKAAQTRQDTLRVRQELVLLNDLARTICVNASDVDSETNCEMYPGNNLLGASHDDTAYFLYVVPTSGSSYKYSSHVSVPVESREGDPVAAMSEMDDVALEERISPPD